MKFDDWTGLDKKAYDLMHGSNRMQQDQHLNELEDNLKCRTSKAEYHPT